MLNIAEKAPKVPRVTSLSNSSLRPPNRLALIYKKEVGYTLLFMSGRMMSLSLSFFSLSDAVIREPVLFSKVLFRFVEKFMSYSLIL